MSEQWIPIPGYEKNYEASNYGRVRSLEHTTEYINGGIKRIRIFPGRILIPQKCVSGRLHVKLTLNGKVKQIMLHRVIAMTFHGVPNNKELEVNHKDGNKLNNKSDNLEWVTRKQNACHARDVLKKQIGENNPVSKLSNDDVINIRNSYIRGTGLHNRGNGKKLAQLYGISQATLSKIILRQTWKHI